MKYERITPSWRNNVKDFKKSCGNPDDIVAAGMGFCLFALLFFGAFAIFG